MITKVDKNALRRKRQTKIRAKVFGTAERPRLNVYRSTVNIYVQLIDDKAGNTLAACSTIDKSLQTALKGKTKKEQAAIVGQEIAKRAAAKKITECVFDRGGYLYTGRVQSLADGARAGGLKF